LSSAIASPNDSVGSTSSGASSEAHPLVQLHDAPHILDQMAGQRGDVLHRGVGKPMGFQMPLGTQIDVEFLDDVHRQADGARLVHDRALDVLANPPGGIGGKAKTTLGIEFLQRVNQPEVALLHQVEQGQTAIGVVLGNVDHQPQVALDHGLPRFEIALHGTPRQGQFLFRGEQRRLADFVEIQLGHIDLRLVENGRCQIFAAVLNPRRFRFGFVAHQVVRVVVRGACS
jgi:hypothetical protein